MGFRFLGSPSQSTDDLRPAIDEYPEGIISVEWPENFSLLSYDDLRAYLENQIISDKMKPTALLGDVMSARIRAATADQTLEEIDHHFEFVSGLPVVDRELRCIGVVSKKDKTKASNGSKVGEVMSTPAITLSPDKTVLEAAATMLKNKIHRIPIYKQGAKSCWYGYSYHYFPSTGGIGFFCTNLITHRCMYVIKDAFELLSSDDYLKF